jgi:hypothetical protein
MKYVHPIISEHEALKKLSKKSLFQKAAALQRIELVYLPFFLHTFEISRSNRTSRLRALCDAVTGVIVVPDDGFKPDFHAHRESRDYLIEPRLDAQSAQEIAREQVMQLVLREAFKQPLGRELNIRQIAILQIALPYWVAYAKKGERYSIKTIDGSTGAKTGFRLRSALLAGITAPPVRSTGAQKNCNQSPLA